MILAAEGVAGSSYDYIKGVRAHLAELGVTDPAVELLWDGGRCVKRALSMIAAQAFDDWNKLRYIDPVLFHGCCSQREFSIMRLAVTGLSSPSRSSPSPWLQYPDAGGPIRRVAERLGGSSPERLAGNSIVS